MIAADVPAHHAPCTAGRRKRVEASGASAVVLSRSIPVAVGAVDEVVRRWNLCDRRAGRRSRIGEQVDGSSYVDGRLRGFAIRGRTAAWVSESTERFGPTASTVHVRRLGGRTRSFRVPYGRARSATFEAVTVGRLRLSSSGAVAFIAGGGTYRDVLWTVGSDGIGRRVDGTPRWGIRRVGWDDARTLTWRTATATGAAVVPSAPDPCLQHVGRVVDATLLAVRGTDRSKPGGPLVGCLRTTGRPVPLPGHHVDLAEAGSIGLAGPFAATRKDDPSADGGGGTVAVIDLRTGQPVGSARSFTGRDTTVVLGVDGSAAVDGAAG